MLTIYFLLFNSYQTSQSSSLRTLALPPSKNHLTCFFFYFRHDHVKNVDLNFHFQTHSRMHSISFFITIYVCTYVDTVILFHFIFPMKRRLGICVLLHIPWHRPCYGVLNLCAPYFASFMHSTQTWLTLMLRAGAINEFCYIFLLLFFFVFFCTNSCIFK